VESEAVKRERILFCWSGGKDSAMALYEISRGGHHDVAALLTTVTDAYDRISMHGVRRVLLERQVESLGLPLHIVSISPNCTNQEYEAKMDAALAAFQSRGVQQVAFGDIFLEDLRKYREDNLARRRMRGIFPIWKWDTRGLVRAFLGAGFRAVVVCVDTKKLDASFAGREITAEFVRELPENVDPCGENGEFHSFVFDGPLFREPLRFSRGEIVKRDAFCFCDLVPL